MGIPRSGLVSRVLVEDKELGTLTEHLTQELAQKDIFYSIHQKRFFLAEAAPACNGLLQGLFGYNAVTITAQRNLNRTYSYEENFAQATKEICKECACIRLLVPKDSMKLSITKMIGSDSGKGDKISHPLQNQAFILDSILQDANWTTLHIFMH
jgi:hypothetical protein